MSLACPLMCLPCLLTPSALLPFLQAEAVIEVLRDKDPEEKVLIFSE